MFRADLRDPAQRAQALYDAVGAEAATVALIVRQEKDLDFIRAVRALEIRSRAPPRKTILRACDRQAPVTEG